MNRLWTIVDLIDLLYFFRLDEEIRQKEGDSGLVKRDRIIYLTKIKPQMGKVEAIPPRLLVRRWLAIRRLQLQREARQNGAILPGAVWRELMLVCQGLFMLIGIGAGVGLAGSFLLYSGTRPLNVAVFFGLFVVLQLCGLGVQALLLLTRRLRRVEMESNLFYLLLGRLLIRGVDGLRRRLQRQLTGRQRLDLAALVGGVQQRRELAVLVIWPAFILVQLGAIGFNLGVLGTTLAKVVFSDIAFAWQSSLQVSDELVFRLVQWIALPWSWLVERGYPSLEQIQGSQMVLKEGMGQLATADLVAWWPFLCAAVAVYGLLPRLLLLGLGWRQQRRALEQLHFATLGIRPLLARMTSPRLEINGSAAVEPPRSEPGAPQAASRPTAAPWVTLPAAGSGPVLLLIPEELYPDCPRAELLELLRPHTGAARIEPFAYGPPDQAESQWPAHLNAAAGVFLLQEAWQPPLKETETFLRRLRAAAGPQVPLTLLLIGRPQAATSLTPPAPEQQEVWRARIAALADPYLAVQPLVQS